MGAGTKAGEAAGAAVCDEAWVDKDRLQVTGMEMSTETSRESTGASPMQPLSAGHQGALVSAMTQGVHSGTGVVPGTASHHGDRLPASLGWQCWPQGECPRTGLLPAAQHGRSSPASASQAFPAAGGAGPRSRARRRLEE